MQNCFYDQVAAFGLPPFIIRDKRIAGSDYDLVKTIADHYGFIMNVKITKNWGFKGPNGWGGTVKDVSKKILAKFENKSKIFITGYG